MASVKHVPRASGCTIFALFSAFWAIWVVLGVYAPKWLVSAVSG